jgi:GT2 family glycosyltransferase
MQCGAPAMSIVVVSYNVASLLTRCLEAVLAEEVPGGCEVIVVDNASVDGSAAIVRERFPAVRLVANATNAGFARATNQGLALARGRALLLLNPDTEPCPGALGALLDFLDRHPDAAAVGPALRNPDGTRQRACFRFPTLAMFFLDLFPLHPRLMESRLNGRYPAERRGRPFRIDHPLGACILIRREALDRVGPLDEGYFMYCEEVDWCWRARRAGWQIYHVPRAVVVHHGGQSARQAPEAMFIALYRSRLRLIERTCGPAKRAAARAIMRAGLLARVAATGLRAVAGRGALAEAVRWWQTYRAVFAPR